MYCEQFKMKIDADRSDALAQILASNTLKASSGGGGSSGGSSSTVLAQDLVVQGVSPELAAKLIRDQGTAAETLKSVRSPALRGIRLLLLDINLRYRVTPPYNNFP